MKLFNRKVADKETELTVKLVVGDKELPMNRHLRKVTDAELRKYVAKNGSLINPETLERPEVIFYQDKPGSNIQMRLKTDSEDLRAWLKSKGLDVHGEIVTPEAQQPETAES